MQSIEPLAPAFNLKDAAQAYSIWYASTDGVSGSGVVTDTGAIFIPKGSPPKGGWPVVAWTHGTVGVGDNCAPSRNPRTERDSNYLNSWLQEGYAIVATDYQGLGSPGPHPYMHSRAAAYATLDAVRAALGAQLALANRVLLVGQSQGAAAAFATAGYAPAYAPDVNILGTIATGIPNLTPPDSGKVEYREDAQRADAVDPAITYILYIGAAAQRLDPALSAEGVLTPKGLEAMRMSETTCVWQMADVVKKYGLTWKNTFKADFTSYYLPYFKAGYFPTLKISTPVFIGTGTADRDAPANLQEQLVQKICKAGTQTEAHLYPGLDHSQTVMRSFEDSRVFARKVFNGEPVAANCPVAGQ